MVYPKRINWNGTCSGHSPRSRRSQRELVAASLACVPGSGVRRWDETTRTEYRTRAR